MRHCCASPGQSRHACLPNMALSRMLCLITRSACKPSWQSLPAPQNVMLRKRVHTTWTMYVIQGTHLFDKAVMLIFVPVETELADPLKVVGVGAAHFPQLLNHISGMNLNGDQGHHLQVIWDSDNITTYTDVLSVCTCCQYAVLCNSMHT